MPWSESKLAHTQVKEDKAHSDFSFLKNAKDFMRATDEWWNVYKGCASDMIDTTKIPFP